MNDTGAPLPPTNLEPGWYEDPWSVSPWRWWDGEVWTARVHAGDPGSKPKLNSWLSVPVVLGLIVTVIGLFFFVVSRPAQALLAIALGMVPLLLVMPVLAWLDRVEPEPRASRIHALLWGATVAGSISALVNTAVAFQVGEVWAITTSAPLIEELTKGLGIYWALRRREIDGVMDGIVYAGWVGLGFAVIEDFQYFSQPEDIDQLVGVFIMRALLTPFAHPLFTAWTGLAIGLAVNRQQSVPINALWGYGLAVACHACWNGVLTYSAETANGILLLVTVLLFVALFVAAVVTVSLIRRHETRRFTELAPALAQRYGLAPTQVALLTDWRKMLAARKSLPDQQRHNFDQVHAALARLALYHRRTGEPDPATEQRLAAQLHHAVSAQDQVYGA